ncbi:MAG: PASTA domain-containing protein [Anaerolineae bacterium]|nr:PASTA domain-containing protein [Anaerolineae bacterium]
MKKTIMQVLSFAVLGLGLIGCSGVALTSTQNSAIPLTDSAAQEKCLVPEVAGLDQAAAEGMLVGLGLQPVWTNQYDSTTAPGTVISQDPLGGTTLLPCQGDVTVVLSLGAMPETASSPTSEPAAPVESSDAWMALTSPELRVSFEFPPLSGEVTYVYNEWPEQDYDPTGTLVEWSVMREGGGSTFAGCASSNLQVGREASPTAILDWSVDEQSQQYSIQWAVGKSSPVEPLRVVERADGLQGLIYTCGDVFIYGEGIGLVGTCAALSLPDGLAVNTMGFYFVDEISLDDVERVLQSVSFQ